jgi:hypothetical protein
MVIPRRLHSDPIDEIQLQSCQRPSVGFHKFGQRVKAVASNSSLSEGLKAVELSHAKHIQGLGHTLGIRM